MRPEDLAGGPVLRGTRALRLRPATRALPARERRLCSHPDCNTVLSRYNPSEVCAAHGGWAAANSESAATRQQSR
jgi:hypothetical protein